MSDLPFLPLWVSKYDAATAHLTLEEDGAYMRLLRLCWSTPNCSIPKDPKWIMRRMRVDQSTFDRVVEPILEEFFKSKRNRWHNEKLSALYCSKTELVKARKNAGKKGGLAKAQKNKEKGSSKARVLPEQKATIPEPETDITPIVPKIGDVDVVFEEIWKEWLAGLKIAGLQRGKGKAVTKKIFLLKAKKTDPATIKASALAYLQAHRGDRAQFIAGLSSWLNQERFDLGENVVSIAANVDWNLRLDGWVKFQNWHPTWGPKPNEAGCQCPPELLKQGALI